MLAEAQPEPDATQQGESEYSPAETARLHSEAIGEFMDNICEGNNAPPQLVAKMVVHDVIDRMIAWHSQVAHTASEEGASTQSLGWARDAGKFQAIANILTTISVTEDDPTLGQE